MKKLLLFGLLAANMLISCDKESGTNLPEPEPTPTRQTNAADTLNQHRTYGRGYNESTGFPVSER